MNATDINGEKMKLLGTLIAGIAHELNSPMGAIISANYNLRLTTENMGSSLAVFVRSLNGQEAELYYALCDRGFSDEAPKGLEIRREARRDTILSLKEKGVTRADFVGDTLCDIGFMREWEKYLPVLKTPKGIEILERAYRVISIPESLNIIKTASDKAERMLSALKDYSSGNTDAYRETIDLKKEIEILLTLYNNSIKHGVEIERDFADQCLVRGDKSALNLIWMILIDNALRSMNYSGILRIEMRHTGNALTIKFSVVQEKCGDSDIDRSGSGNSFRLDDMESHLSLIQSIAIEQGGSAHSSHENGRSGVSVVLNKV